METQPPPINSPKSTGKFGPGLGIGLSVLFMVGLVVAMVMPGYRAAKRHIPLTHEAKLAKANAALTSNDPKTRFYALGDAARENFTAGNIEVARTNADELLALTAQFADNWNYGNAIQNGNMVLGRIALREGRIEDAKRYLLASSDSKGSPQMDSFGPNMSLAKDLLEKGERDVVLQHFEQCRKFWSSDFSKLDEWAKQVKAGEVPDFGANLVY